LNGPPHGRRALREGSTWQAAYWHESSIAGSARHPRCLSHARQHAARDHVTVVWNRVDEVAGVLPGPRGPQGSYSHPRPPVQVVRTAPARTSVSARLTCRRRKAERARQNLRHARPRAPALLRRQMGHDKTGAPRMTQRRPRPWRAPRRSSPRRRGLELESLAGCTRSFVPLESRRPGSGERGEVTCNVLPNEARALRKR